MYFQHGETALLTACGGGQLDIIEYLHSKGANLNAVDKVRVNFQRTPLNFQLSIRDTTE